MQAPFDDSMKDIANNMGISLYQRFTLNEAALFLRCPISDLQDLVKNKSIQYIQVSKTEVQLFGYQLLQHLLNNVKGLPSSPQPNATIPDNTSDRIIRMQEVQDIVGVSRTTLWRMENKGQFPRRVSLGGNLVGWRWSEVAQWVNER